MQVLIDTNIVLDVLLNRTNFVLPAVKILKLSEDNVQNAVAESHEYDAIITRNKKYYKNSNLKVFLPEEFISEIEKADSVVD